MIACTTCGSTNALGLKACARCGGPLSGAGRSALAREAQEDRLLRAVRDENRIRHLRRTHAVVGAMTFFLLNLLLGLPGSLAPANLAGNAVGSLLFGLPIGYLISRWRAGPVQGALISAGVFVAARLLIGWVSGERGTFIGALGWGLAGALPGFCIGFHVSSDE